MSRARTGHRRRAATAPREPELAVPVRHSTSDRWRPWARLAFFGAWALGSLVAATSIVAVDVPSGWWRPSAAVLLVVFATALTHRAGGRLRLWAGGSIVLAVAALVTQTAWIITSAAALTAVTASVLAVLLTRPARSWAGALVELGTALVVALSGTVAVAAWHAPVDVRPFFLVVLLGACGLAVALVGSLGAGLHGVGPRALMFLLGGAVVVVLVASYASVVRTHGSPALTGFIDSSIIWMRNTVGGVPRPLEALVGFPAIILGAAMRARYRQGWWVSVAGVFATLTVVVALVNPAAYPSYFLMSTLYSTLIGLGLGLTLRWLVVTRGAARSARAADAPYRVEPTRFAPLR